MYCFNPTLDIPDLLHTCSVWPGTGISGFQLPHSGEAYAGFGNGSPQSNISEYIEVSLLDSLIVGSCYRLTFNANLGHLKYST